MNIADLAERSRSVTRCIFSYQRTRAHTHAHILHMLNLRKSQRKQIYTPLHRAQGRKKKVRTSCTGSFAGLNFSRHVSSREPEMREMRGVGGGAKEGRNDDEISRYTTKSSVRVWRY